MKATIEFSIFKHAEFGMIRSFMDERGTVWFVGRDAAVSLGYKRPLNAIGRHVDEDDSLKRGLIDSLGREQTALLINEPGLYALILASKLPKAKQYKRWVTGVVLPRIRLTGGFIPLDDTADDTETTRRALDVVNRTLLLKEELIKAQLPLVRFAEAVSSADDSILIRDLAKLITQNGVPIGQTRLFRWLREKGYLFRRERRPTQRWVESGLFDTTVRLIRTVGGVKEILTTKVTGKGQRYFLEGFIQGRFKAPGGSSRLD